MNAGSGKLNAAWAMWKRCEGLPFGKAIFSRIICFKAPYFGSIRPRFEEFRPGFARVSMKKRRAVTNHIGTVHAIALCNLAEFVGGLACDASIPPSMRWIPKGMTVAYLKKAIGSMRATATPAFAPRESAQGYELPFEVVVANAQGEPVFTATIAMWVSPKTPR